MTRSRLLYALLVLCALLPSTARGTGSLAIPNIIANQAGPNVQASLLDTNWSTVATYVNAREITSGTLGARPVAATAGRWYFASDDNGGTLYYDNGSAWTAVGAGVSSSGAGGYGSRGLAWATATATNTSYNGTADLVVLRNPSTGGILTRTATVTVTNSILTAGPTANGRDRATVFTVSSWVHFYYIYNGSSLDSVSSACAPTDNTGACASAGGPVLPTGYTHWAYIGPVRMATVGSLNATWINASFAAIEPYVVRTTAAGTAAEQSYDDSDRIPPNHRGAFLHLYTNRCDLQADVRVASGGRVGIGTPAAGSNIQCTLSALVPLSAQTVYFIGSATGAEGITLSGYRIPNGGD